MNSDLTTTLVGLIGTAIGGPISWAVNCNGRRTTIAWDMNRELTTEAMARSRAQADRLLKSHRGLTLVEMAQIVPLEEAYHIWFVARFYQRLSLAVKHNRITPKLVVPLFGELCIGGT